MRPTSNSASSSRCHVLLVAFLLGTAALWALPVPPAPAQWLTDKAGLLQADAAERLNAKLREFEQRTGNQFIIYILPSLEGDSLEDFTIRAAEAWKVGQKKYDNGLILFVFPEDRKLRFEVGYGLEPVITDAYASRVLREVITPGFSRGQYESGLNAAVDAIMAKIEGKAPPEPVDGQTGTRNGRSSRLTDLLPLLFILLIFYLFLRPLLRMGGCGCLPLMFLGGGRGTTFGGGGFGGFSGGGGGGGGFGGFSGGGGGFGGGGASGGW